VEGDTLDVPIVFRANCSEACDALTTCAGAGLCAPSDVLSSRCPSNTPCESDAYAPDASVDGAFDGPQGLPSDAGSESGATDGACLWSPDLCQGLNDACCADPAHAIAPHCAFRASCVGSFLPAACGTDRCPAGNYCCPVTGSPGSPNSIACTLPTPQNKCASGDPILCKDDSDCPLMQRCSDIVTSYGVRTCLGFVP
jgi:hypothetical protein